MGLEHENIISCSIWAHSATYYAFCDTQADIWMKQLPRMRSSLVRVLSASLRLWSEVPFLRSIYASAHARSDKLCRARAQQQTETVIGKAAAREEGQIRPPAPNPTPASLKHARPKCFSSPGRGKDFRGPPRENGAATPDRAAGKLPEFQGFGCLFWSACPHEGWSHDFFFRSPCSVENSITSSCPI